MRGLLDRITNRDRLVELELELGDRDLLLKEQGDALIRLKSDLDERELLLERQGETIADLEERAESLVGMVQVLKMRFDTIFPSTTSKVIVDE